jgi:hypothetical protein
MIKCLIMRVLFVCMFVKNALFLRANVRFSLSDINMRVFFTVLTFRVRA